jgi:hypothetical protein
MKGQLRVAKIVGFAHETRILLRAYAVKPMRLHLNGQCGAAGVFLPLRR